MDNEINLNLYRTFYITAKSNSFVEASKRLYISQPAVSKQIKNLEEKLNVKLFYRTSNGLKLTRDGKKLYNYVDKSYNYLLLGERIIDESRNINNGIIIIGAPAYIASFYLLEFIEEYRKKYPNVLFRIINGSTSDLLKALEEHKIDFIVDSSPIVLPNKDIKLEKLESFETCFITYPDNDIHDFIVENEIYIMPYERSSIRKNLEETLNQYGKKLNVVLEVETTDLIITSVKKKIGCGYVVKKSVEDFLADGSLIELKTNYELPKLQLNLLYCEDYLTNLSRYFIKNYFRNRK